MSGPGKAPAQAAAEPGRRRGGAAGPGAAGSRRPASGGARRLRRLSRLTAVVLAVLAMLAVASFGLLLLLSPSAGRAPAITRARDRARGIAYPGPPVPPRFAAALVATEDHRFYHEPGIDVIAVGRVVLGYLRGDGAAQGGATIYQQLAKMLYTPGRSGVLSEAEQVALAIKLSFTYSKAKILQMYADVAYFGDGYYSLGAAACGYFGIPPARLGWAQAALLAGLVQAPSADDPRTSPRLARLREEHVFGRLVATRVLTSAQARAALTGPLRLVAARLARDAPPPGSLACGGIRR